MENVVFFNGIDGSDQPGNDLWVSDGAAAGTFAVGGARDSSVAGASGLGLDPFDITAFGDGVLFDGFNPQDQHPLGLWFSDGTAAGTYEIGGPNSSGLAGAPSGPEGTPSQGLEPSDITVFGKKALFLGFDSDDDDGLWVTDGTTSGTSELGGLRNSGVAGAYFAGLYAANLTPAENKVIFVGRDTDDYTGLWVTDGTTSGTVEIGGLKNAGIAGAPSGGFVGSLAMESFGSGVIFSYAGLWVSDGTAGGTVEIADNPVADLTVFGTKALFDAGGLWITDGTAAGTTEIGGSANAGITGASPLGLGPSDFTVFGDKALFLGSDSTHHQGLWVTDGTASGTTEIGGLQNEGISGASDNGLFARNFASLGTKVLFTGTDPSGQQTLWVTDGTVAGTVEIGGVNNKGVTGAPAAGLDPSSITVSGGIAYFSSRDSTGAVRVWESDGTVAGTHVVAAGPTGLVSDPTDFTAAVSAITTLLPVTADILWQNKSTGQASIWEMDGSALVGGGPVTPNPGTSFHAVGTGDFNKDGKSDILWQNTSTGQASIWEMNGSSLIGGGPVTPNPGPSFRAVGTGDFNGDGFSDILWQNTATGQASIWEMNGNTLEGGGPVTPNPGPSFRAVGTGDFNHDGDSDIVWQNTSTGQVSIWEMQGNKLIGGGPVTPNPGTAWQAIGTGDFNQDGFSDILLQNKTTGAISIWEMNGTGLIGGGQVANPGLSWHAIGTGAGGSDILLQNTSGQAMIWEMDGNTIAGGGPVSPNPGPSFRAVGLT
jgi:ELWxxDGT repeat protein